MSLLVLRGVFSAVATPFHVDESVDARSLRLLVERTLDSRVHGLVACGTTGEVDQLSVVERREVVEVVVDQSGGRVPVLAHTGAAPLKESIELSQHAEQAGVSAVMLDMPRAGSSDPDELELYFRTVADAVGVPVVIDIPALTGVNLTVDQVASLAAKSPNIQYVNDSSNDHGQVSALIRNHAEVLSTFVGSDELLLPALEEGAAGVITGTANVLAPQLVSVYEAVRRGDLISARHQWAALSPAVRFLASGSRAARVKEALEVLGAPLGPVRPPSAVLDAEHRSEIDSILQQLNVEL